MMRRKKLYLILLLLIFGISFLLINGGGSICIAQETDDAKTFKILKEKITNRRTGLPNA